MGKNNRYAAPVSDSQPDASTTGAETSITEAAGIDTLSTETVTASAAAAEATASTLSAEELAALSTGGEPEATEAGPKGSDGVEETPAADKSQPNGGVPVEEPGLPEAVVSTPAPAPVPEVAPTPVPPPAPLAVAPAVVVAASLPVAAVVSAPAPVASASELSNRIELIKKEGSAREKALITFLEGYISNMAPGKPVDEKAGASHQLTLWRTLQSVVERSAGDEFRTLFSLLLDIVAEHQHKRGVFYDKFVFRFADQLTFSRDEQKSFLALLNVLVLTANRATRHIGKKQVDLNRIAATGFTEQGRQNLLAFYK